jgi:CubicO group peptidase (beta-lactamase class C family)
MARRWSGIVLACSLLSGCGPGELIDAGPVDAGARDDDDGGVELDGGTSDGGQTLDDKLLALEGIITAEMEARGVSGAAVAIILDGEIAYARDFGQRSYFDTEPVDEDTLFNIASVSKPISATTILAELEAHPELSLESPVMDHLPSFSFPPEELNADITLGHLLSHTSGLPTYWDDEPSPGEADDDAAVELLTAVLPSLSSAMGQSLFSVPGHGFQYSNAGYGVAALAAEAISGQSFPDLVQTRVTGPLGMTRTFMRGTQVEAAGNFTRGRDLLATGYSTIAPTDIDVAWGRAAGGVWSSAADLARFVQFHLTGDPTVLSDAGRALMASPVVESGWCYSAEAYGYGLQPDTGWLFEEWFVEEGEDVPYRDVLAVGHAGGVPGFRSQILFFPDLNAGYVILQNASPTSLWDARLYIQRHILPLPPVTTSPDVSGDPEAWAAFAGTFLDDLDGFYGVGDLRLSADDGGMTAELPAMDGLFEYDPALEPVCRNTFRFTFADYPYDLILVRDINGAPDLVQMAGATHFVREEAEQDKSLAPAPRPVDVERLRERLRQQRAIDIGRP